MRQEQPEEQTGMAYLVIHREQQTHKRVELWKENTTIGRSRNCDIFLEDISVHRTQASISYTQAGYLLRDDHGSGDSYVNGKAIQEILLCDGDQLLFGTTHLTFYAHEGTRPFQLASSRGKESHMGKKLDPNTSAIAKLDLGDAAGTLQTFDLLPEMTIGRSRECSIFLEDLAVSRLHATIRVVADGGYELEDNHSATGTFINGKAIGLQRLQEGDIVQIGKTQITFRVIHPS